jgi:hypothetical protein
MTTRQSSGWTARRLTHFWRVVKGRCAGQEKLDGPIETGKGSFYGLKSWSLDGLGGPDTGQGWGRKSLLWTYGAQILSPRQQLLHQAGKVQSLNLCSESF